MVERLSRQMARNVMLGAQGLEPAPRRLAAKADVLEAVRRMCLLQIDTIHVVARSPYLVLWSRLGEYESGWLDELLAEGALFEYWAHAACFLPIEDYRLYRRRMLDAVENQGWPFKWPVKWSREHPDVLERVRAHVRDNGAVRSAEFENKDHVSSGWWDWKEEKDALESMWLLGEVMVARRHNFQRVYDLRERVLPGWDDANLASSDEVQRTLDLRSVRALGIALPDWVPDYFRQPKTGVRRRLERLAGEGLLLPVEVEGFRGQAYVHPDCAALVDAARSGRLHVERTTLLSPFDPLVWDRKRARELFDFDYTIECYTPAARRKYGYFTLPILHRGQLVGRLDPKAHRAQGVFEVKAVHLETGVRVDERLIAELAAAMRCLAAWHATPELVIRHSDPADLATRLQAAV